MQQMLAARCVCQATEKSLGGLVWSAGWLRKAEPEAAASLGIDLSKLMIHAGTAAYKACVAHGGRDAKHWVILVGPGNNGGDGYVMARLAKADGRRVTVLAMPHSKPLPTEATNARNMWRDAGGTESTLEEGTVLPPDADLVVDGLLGTGITGAPRGLYASVIEKVNNLSLRRFAIDVPSGLNADTGAAPAACFRADHTITFISLKPGLLTGQAREYVGQLTYDTLGLDAWLTAPERFAEAHCRRLEAAGLGRYFGPQRSPVGHKGSNGKVLLVGGASGFGGAMLMAAEACLATGAGLTRVLTAAEHVTPLLTRCPEAMYIAADTSKPADEEQLASAMAWADVLAVGPGLGQGAFGSSVVAAVLRYGATHPEKAVILDADALNLLPQCLATLAPSTSSPVRIARSVITPHPGEAARLLGSSVAAVEADRFEAARQLAAKLGGVCCLKGAGTVVYQHSDEAPERACSPQHCAIVDAGNAGMATGGMGDVLTGVAASVVAQKLGGASVFDAACAAALAHSVAADLAAAGRGTRGLRATELAPRLTQCLNPSTSSFSHVQ